MRRRPLLPACRARIAARCRRVAGGLLALTAGLLLATAGAAPAPARVLVLPVEGPLGPATADWLTGEIEAAERAGDAAAIVLRLDTPGGLDTAMRQIIHGILDSGLPILAWVPPGGRAASAGTYILYASHLAAMAPGSNLGAATPVQIGGGGEQADAPAADTDTAADSDAAALRRKRRSDAAAYLRSLAELRGRDTGWVEQAVLEGASLTASEARERGVIELLAADVDALLAAADGRQITLQGQTQTLALAGARLEQRQPDWRVRILAALTHPNVAYVLMLIGIYGLIFELASPGSFGPGIIGGICLLLALYAFQVLPVSYAGLGLIALGALLMLAEVFAPSFGLLGLGGIGALTAGSLLLFDTDLPAYRVSLELVAAAAIAGGLALLALLLWAGRAQRRPAVTGGGGLLGETGEVVQAGTPTAPLMVHVHGEHWQAEASAALAAGTPVRVVGRHGLRLTVEPIDEKDRS